MARVTVFVVLASIIYIVNGQCPSSKQVKTKCKSLYSCPPLMELVAKTDRTEQETANLKKSQCGYNATAPMVCCPEPCYTPEGAPGKCVSLFSCPRLVDLLKNKPTPDNMNYVTNSICNGPDQYSVCCGSSDKIVTSSNCPATNTAFPPDPTTKCCGRDSNVGNKIFGGNETAVDQYPWLVLLEYSKQGEIRTVCGGSLISNRYVLTAAHCLVGRILQIHGPPVYARLGEYDTRNEGRDCKKVEAMGEDCTDGTVTIPVEEAIAHPNYGRPPRKNDIGLIRLASPAPYTDFIRPICLPSSDITLNPPSEFILYASGWGAISETQRFSPIKMHVDVPFVNQANCQQAYNDPKIRHTLSSTQMCAGGENGKDTCKGDSGGPLMYENGQTYEVLGVTSFGHEFCGTESVPGVYTKVWEYDNWIRSNIRS